MTVLAPLVGRRFINLLRFARSRFVRLWSLDATFLVIWFLARRSSLALRFSSSIASRLASSSAFFCSRLVFLCWFRAVAFAMTVLAPLVGRRFINLLRFARSRFVRLWSLVATFFVIWFLALRSSSALRLLFSRALRLASSSAFFCSRVDFRSAFKAIAFEITLFDPLVISRFINFLRFSRLRLVRLWSLVATFLVVWFLALRSSLALRLLFSRALRLASSFNFFCSRLDFLCWFKAVAFAMTVLAPLVISRFINFLRFSRLRLVRLWSLVATFLVVWFLARLSSLARRLLFSRAFRLASSSAFFCSRLVFLCWFKAVAFAMTVLAPLVGRRFINFLRFSRSRLVRLWSLDATFFVVLFRASRLFFTFWFNRWPSFLIESIFVFAFTTFPINIFRSSGVKLLRLFK